MLITATPLLALAQIGGSGSTWHYTSQAIADRVDRVPGQPDVSFSQFAGFVGIGDSTGPRRDIFYWFVESQRDPANDPLLLWTNGGPGCSGLLGKLTEMGPFRAANNGTGLDLMQYAWNREASIIFVEQPLFTGFSISDDPSDAITTDEINAERLTTFIDRWLVRFPGYRQNDFYLSSESYGGHYVPHTLSAILRHNARQLERSRTASLRLNVTVNEPLINLRGAMLGNPYTDPVENAIGMMDAAWGHGLLPTDAYETWRRKCPRGATRMATRQDGYLYSYDEDDPDTAAGRASTIRGASDGAVLCFTDGFSEYRTWVGDDERVNPYALGFPTCKGGGLTMGGGGNYAQRFRLFSLLQRREGANVVGDGTSNPNRLLYSPCGEDFMTTYLNRADVRAALHVDHDRPWAPCDDSLFEGYDETSHDAPQQPLWREIIRKTDWSSLQMEPLKLLIFSGDNDAICGVHGTQRWIGTLGLERTSYWQPWKFTDPLYGEQLGG